MWVFKSHRIELAPNKRERTSLRAYAGTARWVYNWGLSQRIEEYRTTGKSPSIFDLSRRLTRLKTQEANWLGGVSKYIPQYALAALDTAYKNFFRRCKNGEARKGFPKFKSRKSSRSSFTFGGPRLRLENQCVVFPKLGSIRLKQDIAVPLGKLYSVTVSEEADRWFVSLSFKEDVPDPVQPQGEVLGIDLGIKTLATLSDGTKFENPKALAKHERKLKHLQRALARKVKGSNNSWSAKKRLRRQHYKIKCVRRDAQHKMTTAIVKRASVLVLEDLNVTGLKKNHCLAKAVSDASFGEVRRQLEYKARWRGVPVILADRWYPSSKTCSSCGCVKAELSLSERKYCCEGCGLVLDRDHNAAINLKNLAVESTVTACGGVISPESQALAVPMKQELSSSRNRA